MRLFPFLGPATLGAALLFATAARAEPRAHGVAPAGGGLEAMEATFENGKLTWRSGATSSSMPIPFPKPDARITTIAIGEGKHVLHARVTEGARAYEAVLAGGREIFAGYTGYTTGEEGDRAGQVVEIMDRDDATKFVLVGDVREDTRICGQAATPLSVRGLDPKSLQLRGASLHRIAKKDRDAATPIVATASNARAPLARLLAASGASGGKPTALTDGDPATTWSEERPGDGHGEFVALRAPTEVPLHALLVTPVPTSASAAARVAPRTFFVATDARLFRVTMPEDGKAGVSYEVPFPEPVRTACVTIVLDEAYERDVDAPVVAIAELAARAKMDVDGASLDDVVKELSGPRAEEAAAMLRRGGDAALGAVSAARGLDAKARAYAVDIASSTGTCSGPAMELLTRALADKEGEVRRRASGRIERCGKQATESLVLAVRSNEEPRRAASAGLLASIAPAAAFDPLSETAGAGTLETRRAVRAALGRAAAAVPREKLVAALAQKDRSESARLDLVRALGPRLADVRAEAGAAIAELLAAAPDARTRWLLAEPLAQLGDAERLGALLNDPDWTVRARAVEAAGALPALVSAIPRSASDPHPRVREASFHAYAASARPQAVAGSAIGAAVSGPDPAATAATRALATDEWSFVRVAAAEALGSSRAEPAALAKALGDRSAKVRASVVTALGASDARGQGAAVRARLDDLREDTEVRALAARTLGKLCVQNAADRLTHLALLAQSPVDEADERIGHAALEALGALHPPDLAKRLAPLRDPKSKTLLKRAADAAVAEPGTCR